MDLEHFLAAHVRSSTQHRRFYHFTDKKNLDLIRKHGILSTAELRRRNLLSQVTTGGDNNSLISDTQKGTDGYVCLCFTNNHPMCHVASVAGRIDPVYLQVIPEVIKLPGVMITNAPSNQNGVDRVAAAQALDQIDLPIIYTRTDWTVPAIQARLAIADKYEILVPVGVHINNIVAGL
jgi:ssDNA thymidine ADP-ribosyltransferase DarT-like protein